MRRFVLLLDGTWNTPKDKTNIYRLKELIAAVDEAGDEPIEQVVKYDVGVGTNRFDRIRGGAFGLGLSDNVREWYQWLSDNHQDGDELFIFGFSRGAYTARSLAGLISRFGLMPSNPEHECDAVWAKYTDGKRGRDGERREVDIDFIGVFDTVGALGVPMGPIRTKFTRKGTLFHRTTPSARYRAMYQALAIDENRKPYEASMWTQYAHGFNEPAELKDYQAVEQRWFVGVHSNVGGGYPNNPLAKLPLAWMVERAATHGLAFSGAVDLDGTEHLGPLTDSYKKFLGGLYRLVRRGRRFWRPIGADPREVEVEATGQKGRSFPINEVVDESVFRRYQEMDYRPDGLEEWAGRAGVDLASCSAEQLAGRQL